jgi:hypothetical protein
MHSSTRLVPVLACLLFTFFNAVQSSILAAQLGLASDGNFCASPGKFSRYIPEEDWKIYNGLMKKAYGFIKNFKPLPESVEMTESEEINYIDKDDESPFITFKTITTEAEYSVTYFYWHNVLRIAFLKDDNFVAGGKAAWALTDLSAAKLKLHAVIDAILANDGLEKALLSLKSKYNLDPKTVKNSMVLAAFGLEHRKHLIARDEPSQNYLQNGEFVSIYEPDTLDSISIGLVNGKIVGPIKEDHDDIIEALCSPWALLVLIIILTYDKMIGF